MQLPDFFLPDKPGQNDRGFSKPGPSFNYIVIYPISFLKPQAVAAGNVGIPNSQIDKGGYAKKAYSRKNNFQNQPQFKFYTD